jgi:hypothetical protein
MTTIHFRAGELTSAEQAVVTNGFARHSAALAAPPFTKSRLVWCAHDKDGTLVGATTADQLWDWIYIDELWVEDSCRGARRGVALDPELASGGVLPSPRVYRVHPV